MTLMSETFLLCVMFLLQMIKSLHLLRGLKRTPNAAVVKPEPEKKEPFVKWLKHILRNDENLKSLIHGQVAKYT